MLADEGVDTGHSGTLAAGVHLPGEWLSSLIAFIASVLPGWRDDPSRPAEKGETKLTTQLCSRLNSVSRHRPGWDFLQFRREEPDEVDGRRSIDLVSAPAGKIIWIEGRQYTEYQALLPIECKRLPTPIAGPHDTRDEREYLISRSSSTGGIQRFKAGHHAAAHPRAAMIAYVQDQDIAHWQKTLDTWIDGIVALPGSGWSASDKLKLGVHDKVQRTATLASNHDRLRGLGPIHIDHLWIEI